MKKKIAVIITTLTILLTLGLLIISTGGKMTGIMINKYSISDDGNIMTLKVGVASSMGYVRTVKVKQDENKKFLTFYSTYGFNSTIGAKSEFQIDLDSITDEIYFFSGDSSYDLKLQKITEAAEWVFVK